MKKIYFLIVALCVVSIAKAQIINFPDANFKAKLLQASPSNQIASTATPNVNGDVTTYNYIDTNFNGEIEIAEAQAIKYLKVRFSNITDLEGIGYFTNLIVLDCYENQIADLNLTLNTALVHLQCSNNLLSTLNLHNNVNLKILGCGNNQLASLDLSTNISLNGVGCSYNNMSSLILPSSNQLWRVDCDNNSLESVDFSNCTGLNELVCDNNNLITLDLTNTKIRYLKCQNNQLVSIKLKNNDPYLLQNPFDFSNNPNLEFICCDTGDLSFLQQKVIEYSYTNCQVTNLNCEYALGYDVAGNARYDNANNGCGSVDDILVPNLKYSIFDGNITRITYGNQLGNYFLALEEGNFTVTPILENPNYFAVSPNNFVVDFSTPSGNTVGQNFCLTNLTNLTDFDITILPLTPARPGFDTKYRVVIRNKANYNGQVYAEFTYNDDLLDFTSASPNVSFTNSNSLYWYVYLIRPFQTFSFDITFNVNSPSDALPVNIGDVLNFTGKVYTDFEEDYIPYFDVDSFPSDNIFVLDQMVVGAYDPNDKVCLQGETEDISIVGNYVHYMIRFENTGTFSAERVVVEDMIDVSKFDISTLVPLSGSHPYYTKISNNKVEFIFENINLPFDDANNDGYVAFKIKTKPSLVNGDTFSNSASIYFDYNFPIVTNTATTTIQALSTQDFEFGQYFNLYPNPVNTVLNVDTKQTIEVSSISIYNQLGQLVVVVPSAQNVKTIDVSSLSAGNYFIKINSNKGTSNAKFIKR